MAKYNQEEEQKIVKVELEEAFWYKTNGKYPLTYITRLDKSSPSECAQTCLSIDCHSFDLRSDGYCYLNYNYDKFKEYIWVDQTRQVYTSLEREATITDHYERAGVKFDEDDELECTYRPSHSTENIRLCKS